MEKVISEWHKKAIQEAAFRKWKVSDTDDDGNIRYVRNNQTVRLKTIKRYQEYELFYKLLNSLDKLKP